MYNLKIKKDLEVAHFLPNYDGICNFCHGHRICTTWYFYGCIKHEDGMIEDFKYLNGIIDKVINKYDHHLLNDFIENPTLENLAEILLKEANKIYSYERGTNIRGRFTKIEAWETSKYGVEYSE